MKFYNKFFAHKSVWRILSDNRNLALNCVHNLEGAEG